MALFPGDEIIEIIEGLNDELTLVKQQETQDRFQIKDKWSEWQQVPEALWILRLFTTLTRRYWGDVNNIHDSTDFATMEIFVV